MKLDDLIAAGAIIAPSSVRVKKNVTWKHRDERGKPITHTFDVHIKKDMSAADFQFIFTGSDKDENAIMSRRVHRLVNLGEEGEEKIPYEAAASMRVGLLLAICQALNEVEKENVGSESEDLAVDGDQEKN